MAVLVWFNGGPTNEGLRTSGSVLCEGLRGLVIHPGRQGMVWEGVKLLDTGNPASVAGLGYQYHG
jgi:hypothetical protein